MMIPLATSADERPINPAQAQRQRHRQSHNPSATLIDPSPPKPEYLTDEYVLHPSVWAWKQANPSRHMIGFGHYVILQTLGEGEFGKVKLGIHTEYGNQVAVKLIKRGSLEDTTRASKVEREIDVLKVSAAIASTSKSHVRPSNIPISSECTTLFRLTRSSGSYWSMQAVSNKCSHKQQLMV